VTSATSACSRSSPCEVTAGVHARAGSRAIAGRRRLPLPSLRHQHPHRTARLPGGPAPRPRPGRGPDQGRQRQRAGPASVPRVRHQSGMGAARRGRRRPHRVAPDARPRRRTRQG
jgi:hypothetical protein